MIDKAEILRVTLKHRFSFSDFAIHNAECQEPADHAAVGVRIQVGLPLPEAAALSILPSIHSSPISKAQSLCALLSRAPPVVAIIASLGCWKPSLVRTVSTCSRFSLPALAASRTRSASPR